MQGQIEEITRRASVALSQAEIQLLFKPEVESTLTSTTSSHDEEEMKSSNPEVSPKLDTHTTKILAEMTSSSENSDLFGTAQKESPKKDEDDSKKEYVRRRSTPSLIKHYFE